MKFSIVTITLNAGKFLKETLHSIHNQTFTDYEHIVWDGGSRDKTLEIVQEFDHIRLFQGQDSGIADAMNKGAERASGDYLMWIHADDKLADPNALKRVARYIDRFPQDPWFYGQGLMIDHLSKPLQPVHLQAFNRKALLHRCFIVHPSTVVKRDLFEKMKGYNPSLRYTMDYDLWLRMSRRVTPRIMPFMVSQFRYHRDSTSVRYQLQQIDEAHHKVKRKQCRNPLLRYQLFREWKRTRELSLQGALR